MYARSCESSRQEKEVLTVKHQNNIPCYKARKLVADSKIITYFQAGQRNKSQYNKWETIVKTLIRLEAGDWEIKASHDTTRAADTSTISVDLAENREESSAQTQSRLGQIDTEEKTTITPTTRPGKYPVSKSPTQIRSKDKRSQYNLPLRQIPLLKKTNT